MGERSGAAESDRPHGRRCATRDAGCAGSGRLLPGPWFWASRALLPGLALALLVTEPFLYALSGAPVARAEIEPRVLELGLPEPASGADRQAPGSGAGAVYQRG